MDFDLLARMRYCRAMLYRHRPEPATRRGRYDPNHAYYLGQLNALYRVAVSLGLGEQAHQIANASEAEAATW